MRSRVALLCPMRKPKASQSALIRLFYALWQLRVERLLRVVCASRAAALRHFESVASRFAFVVRFRNEFTELSQRLRNVCLLLPSCAKYEAPHMCKIGSSQLFCTRRAKKFSRKTPFRRRFGGQNRNADCGAVSNATRVQFSPSSISNLKLQTSNSELQAQSNKL